MGKLTFDMLGLWWGYPTWRLTCYVVACNAILNAKYIKHLQLWGICFLFSFFSSWQVLILVCLFVVPFSTLLLVLFFVGSFSWNYTRYMWVILFLLGFLVVNTVNDAIIMYWHLLHSSLSRETASWKSTLEKKKICVRKMIVEVGFSLVVLGATWGTLGCGYNRYDVILTPFYWVCC